MYWLRAQFKLRSLDDLQLLVALYGPEIQGELTFTDNCQKRVKECIKIAWGDDPFTALLEKLKAKKLAREKAGVIVCRLSGPGTVKSVSQRPERLDPTQFEHPDKPLLLEWAHHIDDMIGAEIGRENDEGWIHKPPEKKLADMKLLHTAIRLSKHATHSVPCRSGFLISNAESVYLSYVGLGHADAAIGDTDVVSTGLMFDKDDGFLCAFSHERVSYLNEKVDRWKEGGCKHSLASYLDQYEGNGVIQRDPTLISAVPAIGKKRARDDEPLKSDKENKKLKQSHPAHDASSLSGDDDDDDDADVECHYDEVAELWEESVYDEDDTCSDGEEKDYQ